MTYETATEALTSHAIREYIRGHDRLLSYAPHDSRPFTCDMAVVRDGDYEGCRNLAVAFGAGCVDDEWETSAMCAFHANRAGKRNVATLETILQAAKAAS